MNEVVMIQMSREDLRGVLREAMELAAYSQVDAAMVGRHVVDRAYLERNLKWSRRQIEELERENKLHPVFTGNDRARHYNLGECLKLKSEM